MRKGNQTILLLGMTGLGLAIAMFMDGMKQTKPEAQEQPLPRGATTPEPDPEPKQADGPGPSAAPEPEDALLGPPEPSEGEAEAELELGTASTPSPEGDHENEGSAPDYRSLYLAEKEKNDFIEALENMQDHSYRGDGSKWSKRLYFMKEAYRRSREATPVHASAYLAAAMRDPMTFVGDLDSDKASRDRRPKKTKMRQEKHRARGKPDGQNQRKQEQQQQRAEEAVSLVSNADANGSAYDKKVFLESRRRLRASRASAKTATA